MKFPYSISDFHRVITEDYLYVDRSTHISDIESAGKQLLFLRPRRFGKSLLLSMLENYYDVAKADQFDRLFGQLAIGRNPTSKHNQYFVLKWDFSAVDPAGDVEQLHRALHVHINDRIARFDRYYRKWLPHSIAVNEGNAVSSFERLLNAIKETPHELYLLIDEYDNFANEILMSGQSASRSRYESLLQGEGALKTVFKSVKAGAAGLGLDRVFITGVAPVVLSDLSSGYNVAENIYLDPRFHDLCGFTNAEIGDALRLVMADRGLPAEEAEAALNQMRLYYDGYRFADTPADPIYNPTLALYFLKHYLTHGKAPANLLDTNLAMDRGKLSYVAELPGGANVIADALADAPTLSVPALAERFGVEDLRSIRKDRDFQISLLYFFGVLTLEGVDEFGDLRLRIPNLVIRKLYAEQLRDLLLPEIEDQLAGRRAARDMFRNGDPQTLCEFVEQTYFKVFDNRDYLQANELTIKTAFLTLLFDSLHYTLDSETALGRRYADLSLILRPEARDRKLFDLLLEFKFLKPGALDLSGEQLRAMSREELAALPAVQQKLAEARTQAADYARELRERHGNGLRLRTHAIVALGFERLVWEAIVA
jgi:hypothetical protein